MRIKTKKGMEGVWMIIASAIVVMIIAIVVLAITKPGLVSQGKSAELLGSCENQGRGLRPHKIREAA